MKNIKFKIKQIMPLIYVSKYKDANGNRFVAVWRQWFGKVLWSRHLAV